LVFENLDQSELDAAWRTLRSLRSMLKVLLPLLVAVILSRGPCISHAQERPEPSTKKELGDEGKHHPEGPAEDKNFPEAEFVVSSKFRSVSHVQPLVSGLNFEGHYFGVEDLDVAAINGSWTFRLGKRVKLSPGLGVYFGEHQRTGPAFTFRWDVEKGPVISQGLFIQGFRRTILEPAEGEEGEQKEVYPNIWDGNHVSLRYKRFEIGPSWERIHTREGNEWKGGGRVAIRIFPHVSVVVFVMAPETEVRGGIIVHPSRREE